MAGDITIKISNAEIQNAIAKLKSWETKKIEALTRLVNDTAISVHNYASRHSPVVTNRYRSSLHIQTGAPQPYQYSDKEGNTWDGTIQINLPKMAAIVGTNVDYAFYVERRHFVLSRAAQVHRSKFRNGAIAILRK